LADHLDQHALSPAAVELAVEDLLPRAEVELAARDRDDDLAPHDLPLQVGVGVVLAGVVVAVLLGRSVRGEALEPALVVLVEARLVVVDEDGRGDVHGVHEHEPLAHAALRDGAGDLARDVHEPAPRRDVEPELLAMALHVASRGRPSGYDASQRCTARFAESWLEYRWKSRTVNGSQRRRPFIARKLPTARCGVAFRRASVRCGENFLPSGATPARTTAASTRFRRSTSASLFSIPAHSTCGSPRGGK